MTARSHIWHARLTVTDPKHIYCFSTPKTRCLNHRERHTAPSTLELFVHDQGHLERFLHVSIPCRFHIKNNFCPPCVLPYPHHHQDHQMCHRRVACYKCPNQGCGRIAERIEGTIKACRYQEIFDRTGDERGLDKCIVTLQGFPSLKIYDAGVADSFCHVCEALQQTRQLQQQHLRRLGDEAQDLELPIGGQCETPGENRLMHRQRRRSQYENQNRVPPELAARRGARRGDGQGGGRR